MKQLGFNIKIKYTKQSVHYRSGYKSDILHNVTEIHYNFPSISIGLPSVAFESDIHGTGLNIFINEIKEFEATIASKESKEF